MAIALEVDIPAFTVLEDAVTVRHGRYLDGRHATKELARVPD
jgi:hypothetical protein